MADLWLADGHVLLLFVGLAIGTLGTLVGAGGGFLLVPVLLFLMPEETPDHITAISMAVVFFNASSGTVAYARMRRIDFASGWRFALAALPGALLGAVATSFISRLWFDRVLGAALVVMATFLLRKSLGRKSDSASNDVDERAFVPSRSVLRLGAMISAGVGFISSALGIGGGIVHVPALVYVLGYPVHIATATSHFVLACTSLVAVGEHVWHGSYQGNIPKVVVLSVGAVVGAQVGAFLSTKVHGKLIIVGLALGLIIAGTRLVVHSL